MEGQELERQDCERRRSTWERGPEGHLGESVRSSWESRGPTESVKDTWHTQVGSVEDEVRFSLLKAPAN